MASYKTHEELLDYLGPTAGPNNGLPVLDLACGKGRSGLFLAQRGIPVIFADRSASALDVVTLGLSAHKLAGRIWQVDLEQEGINPFGSQLFSAVVCFRYLHRPLMPYLLNSVMPGGLIIYETFTTDNLLFGRPNNPDFLLEPGELETYFEDWQILHHYEGIQTGPDRAVAQIVAGNPPPA